MTKECQSYCEHRQATIDDIPGILNDLLEAELSDCRRLGIDPVIGAVTSLKGSETVIAFSPDDKPMALVGVDPEGYAWMLNTNEVLKHPRAFMRWLKGYISYKSYKILHSVIDIQNVTRIRMLKRVGFKLLRLLPVEMNGRNHYFVEIVRI